MMPQSDFALIDEKNIIIYFRKLQNRWSPGIQWNSISDDPLNVLVDFSNYALPTERVCSSLVKYLSGMFFITQICKYTQ